MNRVQILQVDITKLDVDAIVNAANTSLMGGSGVDGAIHRAAGPGLAMECIKQGGCKPGQAKITSGHRLAARHIIHTVGPFWRGGGHGEDEILASCYRNSFRLAREHALVSIAFPAISCGIYGFPVERAVVIALRETQVVLAEDSKLQTVMFACREDNVFEAYRNAVGSQEQP